MKILTGKIVSLGMDKTIVVAVNLKRIHPLYKKIMKRTRKYKVHHEEKDLKLGDVVKIIPTVPISKDKHYKLLKSSQ